MSKWITLVFGLGVYSTSQAGDISGEIDRITVVDDVAYINTSPRPTNRLTCATNQWWDYTFDITNDSGKATLSLALSAYATKTIVTVRSNQSCSNVADIEDVKYLILE